MFGSDISDKLLYQNGFSHACAAEKTYFTAFSVRSEKIDDFYSCFKDLNNRALIAERRSLSVDLPFFFSVNVALFIDRLSENVEHSAESFFAYRNLDARIGSDNIHSF